MKEGKFTVLLVDAHTGTPFKEFFDKDGKAYVEGKSLLLGLIRGNSIDKFGTTSDKADSPCRQSVISHFSLCPRPPLQ